MEKIVKLRKDRMCNQCDKIMPKGTLANYFTGKGARFDIEENQIGVYYAHEWRHLPEVNCNDGIII